MRLYNNWCVILFLYGLGLILNIDIKNCNFNGCVIKIMVCFFVIVCYFLLIVILVW